MAVYKCKACGASLEVNGNESVITCDYCDVVNTIPKVQDENLQGLFNRANTLRLKSDFDKAEKLYEKIIESDSTQAEAYWGLILCRYGIEYVEDDKTFKRIPTCHRASFESIIADEDYKSALMYADSIQRMVYEADAREIDRIQKEILAISSKEEPYDVFICYKQTDETGKRTKDSALGNEIYHQLTQEGYKVFYAAITLEDKLGSEYEPIIFAALNSAKIMLVIGTKPEYFNAVWVKNEWSRFMKIMKKDRSKKLFPCYMNMDAYDLPDEFSNLQAQDMSSMAFIPDLVRNIKKIIKDSSDNKNEYENTSVHEASGVERLIKNGLTFIKLGNYKEAEAIYIRATKEHPEDHRGWWGLIQCKTECFEKICNLEEINLWYSYVKRLADSKSIIELEQEYIKYLRKISDYDAKRDIEEKQATINSLTRSINDYENKIKETRNSLSHLELRYKEECEQAEKLIVDFNNSLEIMKTKNKSMNKISLISFVFFVVGIIITIIGFTLEQQMKEIYQSFIALGLVVSVSAFIIMLLAVFSKPDSLRDIEKKCNETIKEKQCYKNEYLKQQIEKTNNIRNYREQIYILQKKHNLLEEYIDVGLDKISDYWLYNKCERVNIEIKENTELKELIKAIEEEFGVSAAAPVMVAGAAAAAPAEEEKTEFDVILKSAGADKIAVIKVITEIMGLGIKEAKEVADSTPRIIKKSISAVDAESIKTKLTEVGAKVEIK